MLQETIPITEKEASQARDYYEKNPLKFFEELLGVDLEEYQKEIVTAVFENDQVAVSACHDVGKSFTFARIVIAYALIFPFSKIITTAPTGRQVKHILWSEIRSAHARAKVPLGGKMLQTEWQLTDQGDWFALGFSPQKDAQVPGSEGQGTSSTFQGFHAPHVLVVFDEATGIPKSIWDMAEGLLTSHNVKFICIGNPTSTQSEFYKCFQSKFWKKIKLSCFNSPNLIANGITNKDELISELNIVRSLNDEEVIARIQSYKVVKNHLLTLRWVVEKALKWGVTHPLFVSKALGEFPEEADNVHIPLGLVEKAQRRVYEPKEGDCRALGIDVARFGSDASAFTYLHGWQQKAVKALHKRDVTEVAGEAMAFMREHGWPDIVCVDETGIGAGVLDILRENQRTLEYGMPRGMQIVGVQNGAACEKDEDVAMFVNVKAQMFDWLAKDMLEGLALLEEDAYQEELPQIIYKYDRKGRLYIESKDEFKKRTGLGSPDRADSLGLANYGRRLLQGFAFSDNLMPTRMKAITAGIASRGNRW